MSTPSPLVRLALCTVAAIYLGCSVLLVAGMRLAGDILPGNMQAMAQGVAIPVTLVWLSTGILLGALGAGRRQQPSPVRTTPDIPWAHTRPITQAAPLSLVRH